jgi:putative polyhydroxyalkanoate system protein
MATCFPPAARMPVIDICRSHHGQPARARAALDEAARSLAASYGIRHRWEGERLLFERSGLRGHVDVGPSDLRLRIELGLLLGTLRPVIEREIERQLDQHLA